MKKVVFQIIFLVLCLSAQAQKVSNIRAEQRGQEIVVLYSLETTSPCEVSLLLSQDNGVNWGSPLKNVSGDVGKNIAAGEKQINWKVLEEREQLVGDKIKFKVVASGKKPLAPTDHEMVFVEGGTFQMGSSSGGPEEAPVHSVTLSSFNIGKYEVTQAQWKAVMGSNPSNFSGCDNCPVENVSWNDVQDFIRNLNVQTGKNYRLPTEAEWELAAMGGKKSKGFMYSGSNNIDDVAWYDANSVTRTNEVGKKKPNELGIFDMSGNVQELCVDFHASYSNEKFINPCGPNNGPGHIMRGGGYNVNGAFAQSKVRNNILPESVFTNVGLRLVHPIYDLKTIEPEMVFVEGGTFQMGSNSGEEDEKPVHAVILSSFKMAKYEVTQAQWKAVMGNNPSQFSNCDKCPVENVTFNNVQEYIERLNSITGKLYRLPTEAEWEYAARGGKKSKGYRYSGSNDFNEVAWCTSSSIHSVGTMTPNELGVFDLSGNVWEWCSDWYGTYNSYSETNPTGASSGQSRVLRGGSWIDTPKECTSSIRRGGDLNYIGGGTGFRLGLQIE